MMAVGGLIMVLFLIAHMYGNLKIFSGQEAFDGYSSYLRTIGYPLLPHSGALWIVRVVLLVSVAPLCQAGCESFMISRESG
ncbi:hypothetical protein AB0301_13995 [Microbacterium profundi]|uniref:Succinate dehydrogenase n=2 Tax=Actinomycetes TaxID=1760 RepID=A0ABV3LJT1_9MICO